MDNSTQTNPDLLSPLTLAFMGDCVYEMLVRKALICEANRPAGELHSAKVKFVSANAQTKAFKIIESVLTEDETSVFKRGRNAHTSHTPKNMTNAEYHTATGFEALFGYLYFADKKDRIDELFKIIWEG